MSNKPFGNYCHKHGKGMFSRCQDCIDELVAIGIQADKDRIAELVRENARLANDMSRCYRMLLSEPDVKGALFKAENILRESLADRGAK
jgi:hypothetical protein